MCSEKQIEEKTCFDCIHYDVCSLWTTTDLDEDKAYEFCFGKCETIDEFATNKGYRKASEVAKEIFAEIEKRLDAITIVMGRLDSLRTFHKTMEAVTAEVDELKKKYTEERK